MVRKSKHVKAQLIELRNAIKRKYRAFKEGTEESDILLEKQYKPIISELRKNTANNLDIKTEQESVKMEEPMEEPMEEEPINYDLTEFESDDDKFLPSGTSTPRAKDLSELVSSPEKLASTTQYINEYFTNPITKEYMYMFIKDSTDKKLIDYIYGPRYENDTLMIGEKIMDFDNKGNIKIGGVNYGKSNGLYELIFKRLPDSTTYDDNDLRTYKSILITTNAHKEGYSFDGKVKSNRGTKYMKIIRPLISQAKGKGMLWKSLKSRDIIHWDDVNELVDRLRHIAMSTEAGNRVHVNEILSIMEELREAGYIKGAGNSRYKALL